MTPAERAAAIARCDEELERLEHTHNEPALLVAMAIFDWEAERRAIEAEAGKAGGK